MNLNSPSIVSGEQDRDDVLVGGAEGVEEDGGSEERFRSQQKGLGMYTMPLQPYLLERVRRYQFIDFSLNIIQ